MHNSTRRNSPLPHMLMAAFLLLGSIQTAWSGDWNLKDSDGITYTLPGLHGKWVLVNFWAPWCPPCLQEMPDLDAVQHRHKDIQVIGVAVMYKNREEVMGMVKKIAVSYPIVFGSEDTAGDFGGLEGMPTSFLYSPAGHLVGRHQGLLTRDQLEQVIARSPDAAALFTR